MKSTEQEKAQNQFSYHQKQSQEVVSKKRCFQKFRKIHRKTPVPESLFNKVADLTEHLCATLSASYENQSTDLRIKTIDKLMMETVVVKCLSDFSANFTCCSLTKGQCDYFMHCSYYMKSTEYKFQLVTPMQYLQIWLFMLIHAVFYKQHFYKQRQAAIV